MTDDPAVCKLCNHHGRNIDCRTACECECWCHDTHRFAINGTPFPPIQQTQTKENTP